MRAFQFLAISAAAVLLLALLAAWQVPGRLDWNRYRATIESLASSTLGRPVTIAGKITLSLLPETELTAADVVVGGETPSAPAFTVKALRLRVAPLPLLSGRVEARELALSGPDLAIDWPLQHGELAGWPPYWLSAFSARIESGRLRIGSVVLEGVDATLQTTEAGGLTASGTGKLGGQAIRLAARLTASGRDGASGINLSVEAMDRLAGVAGSFTGQLASDGDLAGRLDFGGPDWSQLIAGSATPGGNQAFKLTANVQATGENARFDDLTVDVTGPNGVTGLAGTAALRLAPDLRLDAKLLAAKLELDPWLSLLAHMGGGMAVGLDLKAEAVVFGDGLMRRLSTVLEATQAQVALRELSVQLPGEANLRLAGTIQRTDLARPRFDGNVGLSAPRLQETLRWLNAAGFQALPDLPEGVLTATDIRAHAVAEPGLLALDQIDGQLDDATVKGELRLWPRLRAGRETRPAAGAPGNGPAIVASLEVSSLQLDRWLPNPLPRADDLGRGFDVDLRLRTPKASLRGEQITALSLDAAMQAAAPRVTLRQLEATIRGVHLVASGSVAEGGRLTEGKLQANADDASGLADLISPAWRPASGFWNGPAVLNAQLAGPLDALGVKLTLDMADARLEAQPVIDLRAGKWTGSVTLRHPGAPRLLGLLGLTNSASWLGEGSLAVIAHVTGTQASGNLARLSADLLDLTAGDMRVSAPLTLDLTGDVPVVGGLIQAEALALPGPAWRGPAPLAFTLLRGWRASVPVTAKQVLLDRAPMLTEASGTVAVTEGVLRLDPFSAVLAGGQLNGSLVAASADPPTISVKGTLANATARAPADSAPQASLPLDLVAGQVNAGLDLSATGHSPAAMLATLAGNVTLDAANGVVGGFDLFRVTRAMETADPHTRAATEAALRTAVTEGVTNFERLAIRAEAQSGTLTLQQGNLSGTAGTADLSGSVGLAARTMDLRVAMQPAIEAPPEVAVRLTGPWEKPRKTPELAGFLRWLADRKVPVSAP
jgi:hypothetical protein